MGTLKKWKMVELPYIDEDKINEDLNYIAATLLLHKGFDFGKDKTENDENLRFEGDLLMKSGRQVSLIYHYRPDRIHGEDILSLLPEDFGRDVRKLKMLVFTLHRERIDAIMFPDRATDYNELYIKADSEINEIMRKYNYILTVRSL